MKNILLIGIGGTGSDAVDIFFEKCKELGNQTGNNITALVFDTDAGDLKKISAAKTVTMADNASVGTICDRFGREFLKEWFPCDDKAVRSQEMIRGASQWRKKSYLAFLNLMNKPLARSTFISALEDMTTDPGAGCEVYIVASIAGGTGSGSFIPIALYAKRYLRKNLGKDPIINAMLALPDIYADSQTPENRIKVYSNAYAILRELNAINLVARNYNAGVSEHKKAPIRFRIGDAKEPSVGLLFDSMDRQFWTPEAAPFSQVFLLDRIPGINSVSAHNIVLANSLYTILCTDIGAAFDSEFSNHELLRSQNNGSNAIYAGISTAQLRFPKDTVLDYLAHKKTVDSCNNEWLVLHNAVENAIKEKEQQAKACNSRYNMKDDDYARIVVDEIAKLEEQSKDELLSIMERCVYEFDKEGKKLDTTAVSTYIKKIDKHLRSIIESKDVREQELESKKNDAANGKKKLSIEDVVAAGQEMGDTILEYYQGAIEKIKRVSKSTAESIINLDKKKESIVGKEYAIFDNLLKKNGTYVHPVAAMALLCMLRVEIAKKKPKGVKEWDDLKRRNVEEIPEELLTFSQGAESEVEGKSAYLAAGEERFKEIINRDNDFEYAPKGRTNTAADLEAVFQDAKGILDALYIGANNQLLLRVYGEVERKLDIVISKYRSFFKRFEKEKEDLIEQTKTAYRRDAGTVDSVINVFSSGADKDYIYKTIVTDGGPVTDAELFETDDIVGRGVFESVYNSSAAEYCSDGSFNEKDSTTYRSLFSSMVNAYRTFLAKNEEFEKIANYNVVEAMVANTYGKPGDKSFVESLKSRFATAQELATPSIRLDPNESENDLVRPSNIVVFMMSKETARYIKKHADELNISLPADQTKESKVLKAVAEEFIRRYSGNNSARVTIVSSMPDQVLYCTGEIMDITPLRIAKFNELGDDNVYFRNYTLAINNFKKYGTDMWNPHLGNNLHKRGNLPFMNEEKERECDVKVVKALLYGFQKEHIVYRSGIGDSQYFFCHNNKKITDTDGRWINNKNIAQIMSWIRNEDELVEEWSEAFDREIQRQMNLLPSLASDNPGEIANLESALTRTAFMQTLTEKLYNDPSTKNTEAAKKPKLDGSKMVSTKREGPTALEFAYMIKTSEEIGRDCDDAERIIDVLYDTFFKFCSYRTSPQNTPERFIQVYKQQLGKVYETLATSKQICAAGTECYALFNLFTLWLNQSGTFKTISDDTPMDDKGNVCIDSPFSPSAEVRRYLDCIKGGMKTSDKND